MTTLGRAVTQNEAATRKQVSFNEELIIARQRSAEVVALHEALNELAAIDERKSKVVELKFFGGLSIEETAEVLGCLARDCYARLDTCQSLARDSHEQQCDELPPVPQNLVRGLATFLALGLE